MYIIPHSNVLFTPIFRLLIATCPPPLLFLSTLELGAFGILPSTSFLPPLEAFYFLCLTHINTIKPLLSGLVKYRDHVFLQEDDRRV